MTRCLVLGGVLLSFAIGQDSSPSLAGTWVAELAGTVYVRLELASSRESVLTGRIGLGSIEVDADGSVKKAMSVPAELTPIFDVAVHGSVVSFSRKDGDDTDHFEIQLVGGDRCELRFLPSEADRKELAESGIPMLKPVMLKRSARP